MKIAWRHGLTKKQAKALLERFVERALAEHGNRVTEHHQEWQDDTLHFSAKALGMRVSGTATATETEVVVDAKLPLLAKPFESQVSKRIEQELRNLFN
jgi:hypothetical protein